MIIYYDTASSYIKYLGDFYQRKVPRGALLYDHELLSLIIYYEIIKTKGQRLIKSKQNQIMTYYSYYWT